MHFDFEEFQIIVVYYLFKSYFTHKIIFYIYIYIFFTSKLNHLLNTEELP